ncbi:MAG TPA: hypothetical protein VE288_04055 [Rubrobacteraceae bacterium]|jgi:hypothetical protein|nr:hypothetical protein [Rubrobacteraceae bacterium]
MKTSERYELVPLAARVREAEIHHFGNFRVRELAILIHGRINRR